MYINCDDKMSNFKSDCRKFQPNIFNKIKCSHCFKQREEHSTDALESNRASRKVSKCGYLFVAPDWDFSIPLYRTKRWQRRWFVLYDDGELTYSVDDLPATIPQSVIDMNRVLEVSEAEDITGNQFALAITSADRATFVKGTCREESRWWRDVLSVFPKQNGRHKRNATFPGIKSSSNILQQSRTSFSRTPSPALAHSFDSSSSLRPRFLSCTATLFDSGRPSSAPSLESPGDDVFPTKDSHVTSTPIASSTAAYGRLIREDHKENTPPYTQDYHDHPPTSESPPTQDKLPCHRPRTRRMAKREARGLTDPRNELSRKLILSDLEDCKREEKLKDIADSLTRPRTTSILSYVKESADKPTREKENTFSTQTTSPSESFSLDNLALVQQIRGDPDGLEGAPITFTSSPDLQRVDLPAEDVLHLKKGYLMKQGIGQEWNKYWFALEGTGLSFYRDPTAEDNGIMDGIIDLGMAKNIEECEVGRNYGFKISMWEDKTLVLSAVTLGIRTNWVHALRNAANIRETPKRPLTLGEKIEMEINQENRLLDKKPVHVDRITAKDVPDSSRASLFSASEDEEFKSASESFFVSDASTLDVPYHLSVSQDRSRRRSKDNIDHSFRSRSSPPASRKGTRDDFPSVLNRQHCLSQAESLQSVNDMGVMDSSDKTSNGTIASCGETALVDLLETQVETLKAKLEQTQTEELQRRITDQERELIEKKSLITKLEDLGKQFKDERTEMYTKLTEKEKKVKELVSCINQHEGSMQNLRKLLQDSEDKIATMNKETRSHGNDDIIRLRSDHVEAIKQKAKLIAEVSSHKEELLKEISEVAKWKGLVQELKAVLDGKNSDVDLKRIEMENLRENLKSTHQELDRTADRLHRGIEENELLCSRVRELERHLAIGKAQNRRTSSNISISSSRERFSSRRNLPRLNSLSDLTNFDMNLDPEELEKESLVDEYIDLRNRFETAVSEVRAMKREIREIQSQQDDLQLVNKRLDQEIKVNDDNYNSQLNLMSERVQDLTNKLSNSEKQARVIKQKMSRAESKERRRTHSLKGKESFTLSKDIESKLLQLEAKVGAVFNEEGTNSSQATNVSLPEISTAQRSRSFEESTKASRLRRQSLDGSNNGDAIKTILRISELDAKVKILSREDDLKVQFGTSSTNSSSTNISGSTTANNNNSQLSLSTSRAKSPTNPGSPLRSPLRSPSSWRKLLRSPRSTPEKLVKISRSESDVKFLRERISILEKILATLQSKLNECSVWAGTLECSCTCGKPTIQRLQRQLNISIRMLQSRNAAKDHSAIEKLQPLSQQVYDLLKEKVIQLSQKRQHLKASGKWTRDSQLKCFAERLSFETVLLTQLAQLLQASHKPDAYESSTKLQELVEAHRKLSFLEKKLSQADFDMEPMIPLEFYTSLLAEKLIVEGDVISSLVTSKQPPTSTSETCRDLQTKLIERERKLATNITEYKEGKLYEIAVVMAKETVMGVQPIHDDSVLLEELRLREAWIMAQDLVTQELVNIEASQSMLRLSHLLTVEGSTDTFIVTQLNAVSLDRLQTGAEESLRQEMEESVFTLSNKYEEVLSKYRSGDNSIINTVSSDINVLLGEFASVIAQKALLDGQLAVATGDESLATATEPLTIVEETADPLSSAADVVASESHLLMFLGGGDSSVENLVQTALNQAEFTFLYNKLSNQCIVDLSHLISQSNHDQPLRLGSLRSITSSISDRDVEEQSLQVAPVNNCSKIPPSPKRDYSRKSRRLSDVTGMKEKCRQCEELRQDLSRLRRSLELKRVKKQEKDCSKCREYCSTIKTMEESQREEKFVRDRQKLEIDTSKFDTPTRDTDDELTELKRRLCLLEEGYETQISVLKKQYESNLGSQTDVSEESVRQRYQLEIKHLRGLCEKGLAAMETSHRRVIVSVQEKHRQELAALQTEKEEALAEETQATLAALDAMRKAHEAEVQKEIAKFKEEYVKHENCSYRRDQSENSGIVRCEIIELSEKYSVKCLQAATQEERLGSLGKQLSEAHLEVADLETRNRQMKARLICQAASLRSEARDDPIALLKARQSELTLKDEEISSLKQKLYKSQMTKQTNMDQMISDRNELDQRSVSDIRCSEWSPASIQLFPKIEQSRSYANLGSCAASDIRRASSFSVSSNCLFDSKNNFKIMDGFPSPFSGFVASRKKVFETSSLRAKKFDFPDRKLYFHAKSTEC